MNNHIQQYIQNGYQYVSNNASAIGATVLVSQTGDRIVKFGQDSAYDVFVTHALHFPSSKFPVFYCHSKPAGAFNAASNKPYTVTEMERLDPLTQVEATTVMTWVRAVFAAWQNSTNISLVPDPYNLTSTLIQLRGVALANLVGLDVLKPANYMARISQCQREIVFIDPLN
ncbi:hypothetical protein [Burkholderia diffusa]|uniref:Uncharacterized protein n=1 Tax=Burkholderia diffusa TaxID=488732 RepID=A0A6P2Q8I4_9BURK|nr:hypothetical protein [Burkholderia diffusa]KAB0659949.1 hypothetical protein F7R23_08115 [Burkholderia diffusa]MBM2656484.1 hypothetical protein [Burkholderia diffusa]VWC18149.1 hypothetical protein BDI24065_05715 [Burkholderia diffusa]